MTLHEANQTIFKFRSEGDYQAGIQFYKSNVHGRFDRPNIQNHAYLLPNLLFCLRKNAQCAEAFVFLHDHMQITALEGLSSYMVREIGWLIWQMTTTLIKWEEKKEIVIAKKYAQAILKRQDIVENKLLFIRLVFELTKLCTDNQTDSKWCLSAMEGIDVASLSDQTEMFQKESGQNIIEQASQREVFLVSLTKLHFAAGGFQQCMDTCELAFRLIQKFHHGNQVWLARRMSMCLREQGNIRAAIETMENIVKRKTDWFLWAELGRMYEIGGEKTKAIRSFAQGILMQGHSEYKVALYEDMARLLMDFKEYSSRPAQFASLAMAVRMEKGWRVPLSLRQMYDVETTVAVDKPSKEMYAHIKPFCKKLVDDTDNKKVSYVKECKGAVTRILNMGENGDGFITSDTGISIYFRMKKLKGEREIVSGDKVKCAYEEKEFRGKRVLNAIWVKKV